MSNNIQDRVGIILAGGYNTRLRPCSIPFTKSLMPIYNKPLIYYSLSLLLMAKIKEILIIHNPDDKLSFLKLFGYGDNLGIKISYKAQERPNGLPEAFILGEEFINHRSCCLVLGDNILYGVGLSQIFDSIGIYGATILGYHVSNPQDYGVLKLDNGIVTDIIEKPKTFVSHYAVPGIYFCDNNVVEIAKSLKPSARGETEITDVLKSYLRSGSLGVRFINRGFSWIDSGNADSMLDASNFIATIERRQSLKIGCIEEICYRNNWISRDQLYKIADSFGQNEYSKYLKDVAFTNQIDK